MKKFVQIFLLLGFTTHIPLSVSSAPASSAPALMLVVLRSKDSATDTLAPIQFPSMASCDLTADHIAKVQTPKASMLGVPGAWKSNFRYDYFLHDPRLTMICIPATNEIPGVSENLNQRGLYRDIYN